MRNVFVLVLVSCFLCGCASLRPKELADYKMLKNHPNYVEVKNEAAAGLLGLLPGVGSFYVGEAGFGILDLLTWPFSIFWDPFVGINGAKVKNYEANSHLLDE